MLPSHSATREALYPREWGIDTDCWVRLQDPETKAIRLLRYVLAGSGVQWFHGPHDGNLVLTFRAVDKGGGPGRAIGSAHRWGPRPLTMAPPTDVQVFPGGLAASVRREVTLAPLVDVELGRGMLASHGYVSAWHEGAPVMEAMDFALGRPYYAFGPVVESAIRRPGTVIYMGTAPEQWGHFLTQGLSRIWYAQQNPEMPILWDAPVLLEHQREVLGAIGLANPQLFLTEASVFEEVVFPYPGVIIGDYLQPAFERAVARIARSPIEPGKKVFLSRSALPQQISVDETALDEMARQRGYEVLHPERYGLLEQAHHISSAELVVGVESSAFHTALLISGQSSTRFRALSRHRGGSGVFEHIRQAKRLDYRTVNFLPDAQLRAHDFPVELDLELVARWLDALSCGEWDPEWVEDRTERPWQGQGSFETLIRHAPARRDRRDELLVRAQRALARTEPELANALGALL